jgi:hypothetical protein
MVRMMLNPVFDVLLLQYLDKKSETFWVRNAPPTESTTEPFHREKARLPTMPHETQVSD